jgi:hypothetical protein
MIHSKSFSWLVNRARASRERESEELFSSPPTERTKTSAIHSKVDFFQPESLLAPKYAEAEIRSCCSDGLFYRASGEAT